MLPIKPEILCVIPARGGSKSVLKKNLRLVGDKPLVTHTIDLAISIPEFDAVCLSSDDPEILKHATGRCLEIVRPDELSDDRATTESVVLHALGTLKKHNFEYVCILEPTSPLRTQNDVINGLRVLLSGRFESVLAVSEVEQSNLGYIKDNSFVPFQCERRRQDRNTVFKETGVFYGCKVSWLKKSNSLLSDPWGAFNVSYESSLDINTEDDINLVNRVWRQRNDKNWK